MKVQHQIKLNDYNSTEGFVHRYRKLIKEVVIPYQYKVLHDMEKGVEKSHVVENFINAGIYITMELICDIDDDAHDELSKIDT